jgi:hypothetical protein
MKPKNNLKNIKGQVQTKGKGGIKQLSKNNPIQQKQNIKKQNIQNQKQKNTNQINPNVYNPYVNNQNNIKEKIKSKSAKRVNKVNKISPPKQIKKIKEYQFMEFHPYTLKDYKELVRNPVVMGPLGANIGTKEWEEKKNKMKKMMNYSNNINKEHKGINKLKKDTPKDEIEKLMKEKIEKSKRYRTYEYGKLIRTGKYKEDFDDKDYNILNKSNENKNEININYNNEENNINNNNIQNEMSYEQLIKQNEEYESKIQDIREHILD